MDTTCWHVNATLRGANLHPGVNLHGANSHLGTNLNLGANCAYEHGFVFIIIKSKLCRIDNLGLGNDGLMLFYLLHVHCTCFSMFIRRGFFFLLTWYRG